MRKAILRLKTDLEKLNRAVGAIEDVLEQSVAADYEKRRKKATQTTAFESIPSSDFYSIWGGAN
ncbi:MAG TPA: hypothetical protein VHY84_22470 [Bryobacteraceae bacterium]|jgi:predicted ribosome quality control (RQC) complex YloA/Tae2 family protein|nr:hypothetical protein [Bryobacteraceae bacterium]